MSPSKSRDYSPTAPSNASKSENTRFAFDGPDIPPRLPPKQPLAMPVQSLDSRPRSRRRRLRALQPAGFAQNLGLERGG